VVNQMNAADEKKLTERAYALSEAEEVDLDGLTVVVEDGQELGPIRHAPRRYSREPDER